MYVKAQLFLGMSVIAAIAFVGCIFEITSGEPKWGTMPTVSILVLSLPLTVLAFLQAVKLAKASMNE
jgi:hypothetical protein